MEIEFQYGSTGVRFEIPDESHSRVMKANKMSVLKDPVGEIYTKLNNPMNSQPFDQLLRKKMRNPEDYIIILVDDHTRPISSKFFLDALSKIFQNHNIGDERIKILVAAGLHRKSSLLELKRMLGEEHINRFDILFHDANNEMELEYIGETSRGTGVYLNTHYVQAAFRIASGYVEPHFFSGYSGGRKAIVPGIAGKSTILRNHSEKNIDSRYARFGILEHNPLHEELVEATRLLKPDFCINAIINQNHQITHIAAGNIFAVHNHLVQIQERECFREISKLYDIVICGNGGFPLDLNLYQAVKSMAIGELACKKQGVIIAVNECRDGVGQEYFNKLNNSGYTPEEIYKNALSGKLNIPDIWQIQVMARILMHHTVYIVSSMKESQIGNIGLKHAETVEKAIKFASKDLQKKMDEISILVLPDGPKVLPKKV
ncbi:MAG: nickel-dependent lactate racemase [Candidatus Lokiarchaeota archaeon]|nr:nickel-dependent lactate racemase [Candidatus Lokiarchaeota archaeon]